MAEAPDAIQADDPVLEVIDIPTSFRDMPQQDDPSYQNRASEIVQFRTELAKRIRVELAMNRPVLVRGWHPDCPLPFTVEGIASARGSLKQTVQVQGQCKRKKSRSRLMHDFFQMHT